MSGSSPDLAGAAGELGGFRPGRWLLGRGWWFLPTLLAIAIALPWIFGERWYADTPYYQAIATQMVREGSWWSPMQGDLHYFNKPPLGFWTHAILVAGFGNVDWAVHAPEAVCYVLMVVLVGWLGTRLHGPVVGELAGCAMALTNDWIWRIGNYKLDFLYALLLLAACACWVRAFVPVPGTQGAPRRKLACCVMAGVCIGGALMTKPLMGLGLPAFGVLWLWLSGLLDRRNAGLIGISVLVGVLIALPWHASMAVLHGHEFTRTYLVDQSVKRATGEMFNDAKPWWWYLGLAAGADGEAVDPRTMYPIYVLAICGLGVVASRWRHAGAGVPRRAGDALAAIWTLAWVVGLSIFVGKRNYYILIVHPGTAWLAGIALGAALAAAIRAYGQRAVGGMARAAAVAGVIACLGLLARVPHAAHKARRELAVPERDAFMAYLREHRVDPVYNCGMPYRMAALEYIQTGVWPRSVVEREPMSPELVPSGALMVYRNDIFQRKDFQSHLDPEDRVLFRSSDGPFAYLVVRRR